MKKSDPVALGRSSSGLGLVVRPEATVAPAFAPVEQPDGSYESSLARVAHLQLFTWRGSGKFVAAADDLGSVRIYARNGTKQGEVAVVTCVQINHWFGTSRPNFEIL